MGKGNTSYVRKATQSAKAKEKKSRSREKRKERRRRAAAEAARAAKAAEATKLEQAKKLGVPDFVTGDTDGDGVMDTYSGGADVRVGDAITKKDIDPKKNPTTTKYYDTHVPAEADKVDADGAVYNDTYFSGSGSDDNFQLPTDEAYINATNYSETVDIKEDSSDDNTTSTNTNTNTNYNPPPEEVVDTSGTASSASQSGTAQGGNYLSEPEGEKIATRARKKRKGKNKLKITRTGDALQTGGSGGGSGLQIT